MGERGYLALGLLLLGASCQTLPNGRAWGQDVTLWPPRETFLSALKRAAFDPWTWVPLLGAGLLALDDFDERVTDWVYERGVFDSEEDADDASDTLRDALFYSAIGTSLAANSGPDASTWTTSKAKGLGVGFAATQGATGFAVSVLKDAFDRERPDGDDRGLPSRHTGLAFSYFRWSSETLDSTSLPDPWKLPARVALGGTAIATGWARIEANRHFATDVLVGASLGNFFSRFFYDAFMGLDGQVRPTGAIDPVEGSFEVGFSWSPR